MGRKTELDKAIQKQVNDLFTRYIQGKVTSEITRLHHGNKKPSTPVTPKKELKEEEGPANVMGTSSSTSGTGPIDVFDTLFGKRKLARRKTPDTTTSKE